MKHSSRTLLPWFVIILLLAVNVWLFQLISSNRIVQMQLLGDLVNLMHHHNNDSAIEHSVQLENVSQMSAALHLVFIGDSVTVPTNSYARYVANSVGSDGSLLIKHDFNGARIMPTQGSVAMETLVNGDRRSPKGLIPLPLGGFF